MILKRSTCECITGAYWVRQHPNKGYLDSLCLIITHSAHKLLPQHDISPNTPQTHSNHIQFSPSYSRKQMGMTQKSHPLKAIDNDVVGLLVIAIICQWTCVRHCNGVAVTINSVDVDCEVVAALANAYST